MHDEHRPLPAGCVTYLEHVAVWMKIEKRKGHRHKVMWSRQITQPLSALCSRSQAASVDSNLALLKGSL